MLFQEIISQEVHWQQLIKPEDKDVSRQVFQSRVGTVKLGSTFGNQLKKEKKKAYSYKGRWLYNSVYLCIYNLCVYIKMPHTAACIRGKGQP